jgi:hypothetical protein
MSSQQTFVKNDAEESHMIQHLPPTFAELSCYSAIRREDNIVAHHFRVMTNSFLSMVFGNCQTSSPRVSACGQHLNVGTSE